MDAGEPSLIEWAAAGRALGQLDEGPESGDHHVVVPFPDGVLVAVMDGLGHGAEAARAARMAGDLIEAHAREPVIAVVERCHAGLRGTRGVVMSLAAFNARASSITWTGVGNVDVVLLRADRTLAPPREALISRGGIVGYQLPPLRERTVPVSRHDTLIMATDGIRSGFITGVDLKRGPRAIADSILIDYGRHSDDALVVVARYIGGSRE
jgi:negative regulator of sigma-B (phosphoserine phosphatase)